MPLPDLDKIRLYLKYPHRFFGRYKEGASNYFILTPTKDSWRIVPFGTREWDTLDQQAWFGHDVDEWYGENSTHTPPDWLPEIPTEEELESVQSVLWADNFDKDKTYPVEDYPKLFDMIKNNHSEEIPFYFVLTEDLYESRFGDGIYRDLAKASFEKSDLESYIQEITTIKDPSTVGFDCFLKQHTLKFEDSRFDVPDFDPSSFEHYTKWKLLKLLEESLI